MLPLWCIDRFQTLSDWVQITHMRPWAGWEGGGGCAFASLYWPVALWLRCALLFTCFFVWRCLAGAGALCGGIVTGGGARCAITCAHNFGLRGRAAKLCAYHIPSGSPMLHSSYVAAKSHSKKQGSAERARLNETIRPESFVVTHVFLHT